ncbi:hypothetical protein [Prevotella sp.]|uniref:hypothetical protein n=1 Tax=Prevotella sp. TaxID=59823 RepID=UPI003FD6C795
MKHYLRFMLVLLLSTLWCVGGYSQTISKITDISNIVSGQKYYIGATTGGNDYYLQLASTSLSESVKGSGVSDKTKANTFIFEGSDQSWSIKIDGTDYYLSLGVNSGRSDNGKVQVVNTSALFTLSNQKSLIRIEKGNCSIQKNNNGLQFGSYKNTQTDVWLEPVESSSTKTATTISFENPNVSLTTINYASFTGQKATLKAGETTLSGALTYSKQDADGVITTLNDDGTLVLSGKAGTATVTAAFNGSAEYASSTASYTVTVKEVIKDIATLKTKIKSTSSGSADPFNLKLTNAIVTYKSGSNVYLQDETGGIYCTASGFDLAANDKVNGIVKVKAYKYRGQNRINYWELAADAITEHNAEFTPEVVTIAQLNADIDKYENMRVKVIGATANAEMANNQTKITQDGETIVLYDKGNSINWDFKANDILDIEGYPINYNNKTKEILVYRKGDVEVNSSVVKTTLSFDPATTEYNVDNNNKDAFTAPTATVKDAEGNIVEGAAITYTSSMPSVATVGETDGKVNFVGFGTTVITANYAGDATHMASKNSYTINYSKVKTTMTWSANEVTANLGEDFTNAPTLSLTADNVSILEGKTIIYTSTDENVAMVDEKNGTVVLMDKEGTTTITATFAGDETYAEASASYILTVKDPNKLEVTFDFVNNVNNKYGYGTGLVPEGAKFTSEDVTITHVKNSTLNKTAFFDDSFRVYSGSQLNISVAAGYYMTKIVFDNIKANTFSCTPGTLNGNVWEGTASSIDLDVNGTNQFKTITVSYAKCPEVVVDENVTQDDMLNLIIDNDNKIVNAKLNRTLIADGGWYTFSVPFDVKDVNSTALSKAEIRKYKSMNGSIMEFEATTELKSGHAYLVKPSVDITTPIFKSVTLSVGDTSKDGENGYEFIATLGSTKLKTDGTNLFLGADNKFYIPTETGKIMKALRGYFVAPSGESGSKMGINIDGETNYITTLNGSAVVYGKVYNLNGQYVGNDVKGLKKGVYVVNGRKFIVK